MFKPIEFTEEQKERAHSREAEEYCVEKTKEEQYRRKYCIEQAVCLEEMRAENLFALADKIYVYIWGVRE
jgi:hypothetical protein